MARTQPNAFVRLFRGETSFDFVGHWRRWFAISGIIIIAGLISLGFRGLNFSIDFRGGTVWEVPTSATVAQARGVLSGVGPDFSQATIQQLTNTQTGQRTIKVEAAAKFVGQSTVVQDVTNALARMAHVSPNDVQLNEIGPSWGHDITVKAIEAVIIFLLVVSAYIWLRFEGKMALSALVALVHDIVITIGLYSLSGFVVSPDTVIAFLTILGYSLYDTIVVFDRIQENTRGLASTNKMTYSDTVNVSVNQVLARSINTSLVAILPILSILVIGAWALGATALEDFGLALFIGLTTGAYSSIFIASPLLALLKEREPRYAEIRRRLAQTRPRRLTPAAALAEAGLSGTGLDLDEAERKAPASASRRAAPEALPAEQEYGRPAAETANGDSPAGTGAGGTAAGGSIPLRRDVPPRSGNRPPPRPRKKGRRH